jgi:hypothetical protein
LRKGIVVEAGKTTEVVIVAPKEPTKTVSGQILDEEGKPLANVMVRVRGKANASVSGFVPHAYADTPTDNEGRINFAVQEPGHYSLTIQVDGYEPAKVDGLVVGDEKVASEFVVKLKRAKEVKGTVEVQVLSANGSPMKGVWVAPLREQKRRPICSIWRMADRAWAVLRQKRLSPLQRFARRRLHLHRDSAF